MKKSIIKVLLIAICMIFVVDINTIAMTQDNMSVYYACDELTGWTYSSQNVHMGTKNTTFKYASESVRGIVNTYVNAAIGMWGDSIKPVYDSNSNAGYIYTMNSPDSYVTASVLIVSQSNSHTQSWQMMINSYYYSTFNDATKIRTIAHEFGHVFGLGHVENNSKIMSGGASSTKNVTDSDLKGMSVVTHTHNHSGTYSYSYESHDANKHKLRCNTCKSYSLQSHQWGGVVCVYCGKTK